jgi:hypothetical protein
VATGASFDASELALSPGGGTVWVYVEAIGGAPTPLPIDIAAGVTSPYWAGAKTIRDKVHIVAAAVDLDIDGMDDGDVEDSQGGLVARNFDGNNAPRQKITLQAVASGWSGNVLLTKSGMPIDVYTAATGGTKLTFNGTDNAFLKTSLPKDLYVEGVEASGSMRDVTLKLSAQDQPGSSDTVPFTVLWVDSVEVSFDGTMSSGNSARNNYRGMTAEDTYSLGFRQFLQAPGRPNGWWGWGLESHAVVQPANFAYPLSGFKLDRDWESKLWNAGGNLVSTGAFSPTVPPGNDTSELAWRDDDPSDSDPIGAIYDTDAPGYAPQIAEPGGTVARYRANFKAFASISVGTTEVRVSPIRTYFVRFSITQTDAPNGFNWVVRNDVTGDNQAGYGTTLLTWDLQ